MRWQRVLPGLLSAIGIVAALLIAIAVVSLSAMLLFRGGSTLNLALLFGETPVWPAMIGALPVWDGIWPACVGTLMLVCLTVSLALLPGIGCGIFLAEYANAWQRRWLGCAVDILAGVPSIVMGLFGFTLILFLRHTFFPQANTSLLLAAVCLSLLILPSMVMTTREAMQALPDELRLTCSALGMNSRQRMRYILLPAASRGILGGVMLSLGRAAEDTAVILLTGVVAGSGFFAGVFDKFQALPFTIYYTAAQYQTPDELDRGFGAALILLLLTAGLLLTAQGIERAYHRRWKKGTI